MKRIALLMAALLVALTAGCGESSDDSSASPDSEIAQISSKNTPATSKARPKPKPKTARGRVKQAVDATDAGGFAGELKVQKVVNDRGGLVIYLRTPEGGFDGASWDDLDQAAGAAFAAAFGKAHYDHAVGVIFRGGLVSTKNGKDLPDANTGIFQMSAADAREIDWSDKDAIEFNIDWSNYRLFAHPALKH